MYHNQAGWCLLHPPPPQSRCEEISEGVRHSQQERLQSGSVLLSDQAVENWVEAAVSVSQAHSQGEGVGLGVVEGFIEGNQVKFDEHPPQGEGLVGQPAEEEGQDYDGDRASEFGVAAVASSLWLWRLRDTVADHAAHDAAAQDEPQQEEVAHGDDDQGDYESQEDFLCLIEPKQDLRIPVVWVGVREAH